MGTATGVTSASAHAAEVTAAASRCGPRRRSGVPLSQSRAAFFDEICTFSHRTGRPAPPLRTALLLTSRPPRAIEVTPAAERARPRRAAALARSGRKTCEIG